MKLFWTLATGASLAIAGLAAQAAPDTSEVQGILTKNACLACHDVSAKKIGPAYKEVAEKHKSDDNAAAVLTKHIREGSSGVWGPVPMPPHPNISDDDLAKVVEWVLAGAPS